MAQTGPAMGHDVDGWRNKTGTFSSAERWAVDMTSTRSLANVRRPHSSPVLVLSSLIVEVQNARHFFVR
jgi:hypothetical protein